MATPLFTGLDHLAGITQCLQEGPTLYLLHGEKPTNLQFHRNLYSSAKAVRQWYIDGNRHFIIIDYAVSGKAERLVVEVPDKWWEQTPTS